MRKTVWFPGLLVLILLQSCTKTIINQQTTVADVKNPVVSLNGTWKFSIDPPAEFHKQDVDFLSWADIQVPGECQMQGFPIKHDKPFVYKLKFRIPDDYQGNQILLNFHGIYSYAKVWINGHYIRDHFGGFTKWDCNITDHVTAGDSAVLTLEVTDRADEISYASGYAKHQIGGILRDVELIALPEIHFKSLWYETELDENFKDSNLGFQYEISKDTAHEISIELFNDQDKLVQQIKKESASRNGEIVMHVENPRLWDAEHPNLYKAVVKLKLSGKTAMSKTINVGFREVEVKGNKLMVNGRHVKLRGVNRHDVHPLLGRVSTAEYELKDVTLAKEANINFIRTSHYPPTERFLELCDKYGIYVEDETAICFVGTHRTEHYNPSNTENDGNYTHQYLSQISEMCMNHRNHPSVIIWSAGNESSFGKNFKASYDWLKENDKTRPVIFSYPGLAPDSVETYEILSIHYPDQKGNQTQYGISVKDFTNEKMPVLFDEWLHVSCYHTATLKEDPNVRNYLGIGLDKAWTKVFEADGGLGGAIWGFVDDIFMLPTDMPGFNEWWGIFDKVNVGSQFSGTTVGYGEWGIVDTWRRKKPEFWNVKKAYSPVRILQTEFDAVLPGGTIRIPVKNRFDHTNLNEIKAAVLQEQYEETLNLPSIEPHSEGEIVIHTQKLNPDEPLVIHFKTDKGQIIDSYTICPAANSNNKEEIKFSGKTKIVTNDSLTVVECENGTEYGINPETGLFTWIKTVQEKINFSGPYLNFRLMGKELKLAYNQMDQYGTGWKLKSFVTEPSDSCIIYHVKGSYAEIENVEFITRIFGNGLISVYYVADKLPSGIIREQGVKFLLQDVIDSVSWKRNGYWSYYPEGHLACEEGKVSLYPETLNKYKQEPGKPWELDSKSFFYNGTSDETGADLTFVAKASKENISHYELLTKMKSKIRVKPVVETSCRINKEMNQVELCINQLIDYPDLAWGNYTKNISSTGRHDGKIMIEVK